MTFIAEDIYSAKAILSKGECLSLIVRSEELGFESSETCTSCKPTRVGIRNNARVEFEDEKLAAMLWQRCKSFIPTTYKKNPVVGLNSSFRFYRYDPGEVFRPHTDSGIERGSGLKTHFTCIFYLNEDFNEGETVFYHKKMLEGEQLADYIIEPQTGKCLVFRHDWWHEARTPANGRKYVLRTDVLYETVQAKLSFGGHW